MKDEGYIKFYCYNEYFSHLIKMPFGEQLLLTRGLNILERSLLPQRVMFSSIIVGVKSNGSSQVIKNRYGDERNNSYTDLLFKCAKRHKFSPEETALYLTDPDSFARAIFQDYISQK